MDESRGADTAHRIARSAWVLGSFSCVALALNAVWNMELAALFGASSALDAFWIALALPKSVADSLHLGLLVLLFIAVFGASNGGADENGRWRLMCSLLNTVLLCTGVCVLVLWIAAPRVVEAMGPGLGADMVAASAHMLRTLSFMLLFTALTGSVAGALVAQQQFLPFALVRVVGLAVQAALLWVLASPLGVDAAVWATLAGASAMFMVCIAFLGRSGMRYRPVIVFRGGEARSALVLFVSLATFSLLVFLNQASDRFFASQLGAGTLSALEFAWKFEIPVSQVASYSVALPAFALFALYAARDRRDRISETLSVSARLTALLVLPLVGFLVVLRSPLTALWLERGAFTSQDSSLVAAIVPFVAVVFAFRAFSPLVVLGLLCLRHSAALFSLLVAEVSLNTVLNLWLSRTMGAKGIVLATAVAIAMANLWLWGLFLRTLGSFRLRSFFRGAWKIAVANLVAVAALSAVRVWGGHGDAAGGGVDLLPWIGAAMAGYAATYVLACLGLGLIEVRWRHGGLPRVGLSSREWRTEGGVAGTVI